MSGVNFSLDEITLEYSTEDYKPQRREPKTGTWYEFNVANARCEQSKKGHLQVVLEAEALDDDGASMFKKYVNVPMPVSIGSIGAPTYAKGLWLMNIVPLFPEHAAYDRIEKDTITGKMAFFKGDVRLEGKEYESAMMKQNQTIGEMAREVAKTWVQDPEAKVESFIDKKFFAQLKRSTDEKYINIDRPFAVAPTNEDVCYDRKEAMSGK